MFPLGFIHVLRAMCRSRQLDLFLGAVRPDLHGWGLTCLLANALLTKSRERESTHMPGNESSHARGVGTGGGGAVWKRYRIHGKEL